MTTPGGGWPSVRTFSPGSLGRHPACNECDAAQRERRMPSSESRDHAAGCPSGKMLGHREAGYTGWVDENGDRVSSAQVVERFPWARRFVEMSDRNRR